MQNQGTNIPKVLKPKNKTIMDLGDSPESEEEENSPSRAAEGLPGPSLNIRLHQKIDVVQQIINVLEKTMSSGKSMHEEKVSSVERSIDRLQKRLDDLKAKLAAINADFSHFSNLIGSEINKLCALDNILRTVEGSQTENDVKILLPDVSKVDKFVEGYAKDKTPEWERLKKEISRLNLESQNASLLLARSVTYKVTLKKIPLTLTESIRVNSLAIAINQYCGKSLNRMYDSSETLVVKYITLTWNQNNPVASTSVNSNTLGIIQDIYKDEGEVLSVEEVHREANVACNEFQNVCVQDSQSGMGRASSSGCLPSGFLVYRHNEPRHSDPISESEETTFSLHQEPSADGNGDVEIVKEVKRSIRVKITAEALRRSLNSMESEKNKHNESSQQTTSVEYPSDLQTVPSNTNTSTSTPVNLRQSSNGSPSNNQTLTDNTKESSTNQLPISAEAIRTDVAVQPSGVTSHHNYYSSCSPGVAQSGYELNELNITGEPVSIASFDLIAENNHRNTDAVQFTKNSASTSAERLLVRELLRLKSIKPGVQIYDTDQRHQDQNLTLSVPEIITPEESENTNNPNATSEQILDGSFIENQISDISGSECFDGVLIRKELISSLKACGISSLRGFQKELLPALIGTQDVICRVDERGGKSTVIAIGILQKIIDKNSSPRVLVATPTIACTDDMVKILRDLAKNTSLVCQNADEITTSTTSRSSFINSSERGGHILVGIPSSILNLFSAQKFQNEAVKTLVLEDVDLMFAQGLKSSIFQVLYALTASTQTIVTCTKLTAAVQEFRKTLRNPTTVILPELPTTLSPEDCNIQSRPKHQKQMQIMNDFVPTTNSRNDSLPNNPDASYSSNCTTERIQSLRNIESNTKELATSSSSPSPASAGTETEVFDSNESESLSTDTFISGDMDMEPSDESENEDTNDPSPASSDNNNSVWTVTRRLSVEQNTLKSTDAVFEDEDEAVMTFIPEDISKQLGIPVKHKSSEEDDNGSNHIYMAVDEDRLKFEALVVALERIKDEKTIVFCNSPERAENLSSRLRQKEFLPQVIHENVTKQDWTTTMLHFCSNGNNICNLVVATDFLTEVSIDSSAVVFNYDWPNPHRNYISRAAFAERRAVRPIKETSAKPLVVSFISSSRLQNVEDLKETFNINIIDHSCC